MAIYVNSGVVSSGIIVENNPMHIESGGTANSTTVSSDGRMYISSGGVANCTTVNKWGGMYIFNGGTANSTTVSSGGSMHIHSGGTATDIVALEGASLGITVAPDTYIQGASAGSAFEMKDAQISGYTVNSRGYISIDSGGVANSTTVSSGGYMSIESGGTANSTTVSSGGYMHIYSGGVANSTTVSSGGSMNIYRGGTATDIVALEGASLEITVAPDTYIQGTYAGSAFEMKDAQISGYTVSSDGRMYIYSGGVANEIIENGGYVYVAEGAEVTFASNTISGLTLSSGYMTVHSNTIANSTTVSSDGRMYISSGGVANCTTVNKWGGMYIFNGGTASIVFNPWQGNIYSSAGAVVEYLERDANVYYGGYSCGVISKYDSVSELNISNFTSVIVYVGGTANSTTVSSGGRMYISSGGVANSTTVNSDGNMYIDSGGVANSTTVNGVGQMYISSGGVANSTTVNSFGHMHISSDGVANSTTVNEWGRMHISSDGVANSTTVNSYGSMNISSDGVANSTTVNSYGSMNIYSGGVANSTTVNSGGRMYIDSGGTATDITALEGAWLYITIAPDTYIQGTSAGSAFEIKEHQISGYTVNNGGIGISSDGVANSTTVNSGGSMYISSGGVANNTNVGSGSNWKDSATIIIRGVANSTTVNEWGGMYIFSGGVANSTTVSSGGRMCIDSGVHRGSLQIDSGAVVSAYEGGIIDFTVADRTVSDDYLINDLLLISGTPTYTITVAADQAAGEYKLAQGASSFTGTISIGNGTTDYGSITVNGEDLVHNDITYSLNQINGNLTLLITTPAIDITPPEKPLAVADITETTNQNVTVTATFSKDSVVNEYSLDNKKWVAYTKPIEFNVNGSVYFRSTDEAGNVSETTEYIVSNIDKVAPEKPLAVADITEATNQNVTVSATFSKDSVVNEYSLDNKKWQTYTQTVEVTENETVYFRSTDEAGNVSETTEYIVSNIDKAAPALPENITAQVGNKQAKLDWTDTSDDGIAGVKGYYVRYSTNENLTGDGEFVAESEMTLNDLPSGIYSYQIRTIDNAGNLSDWSDVQKFKIIQVNNLQGSESLLSWDLTGNTADGYMVEISSDAIKGSLTLYTTSKQMDIFAAPDGSYQWQVAIAGSDNIFQGNDFTAENTGADQQKLVSTANGCMDLFFGKTSSQWTKNYIAQHHGTPGIWSGTGEKVFLQGKNKIADLFVGSTDANVLVLTDDANGDALFVDDIYTALGYQARLNQINEIRAGAGDDIIDMTSQRYAYEGSEMTIYGGDGNDVIWATGSDNDLFGDAGNDRIVGSTGFDLIAGGAGNDTLHSGGGNDIFAFCENWGEDTVEITDNAHITLWFASGDKSNWDSANRIYRNGNNSVTFIGGANSTIDLKFGNDGDQYSDLLEIGAFESAASEKIFEDKNQTVLA